MNVVLTDDIITAREISKLMPFCLVRCTFGSLQDFPRDELGIDIKKQFQPKMKIIRAKKSLVADLRRICNRASTVCIATTVSPEGEYRAWHIAKALKLDLAKTHRVSFTSLAEFCRTCQETIRNIKSFKFNNKLIEAFQTRLVCNRLVEFQISPLVSKLMKSRVRLTSCHLPLLQCLLHNPNKVKESFVRFEIRLQFADGLQSTFDKCFTTHQEGVSFLESVCRSRFEVVVDKGLECIKTRPFTTYSLLKYANNSHLLCQETPSSISEALSRLHFHGKIYSEFAITSPHEAASTALHELDWQHKIQQIHVADINQQMIEDSAPELDKILYSVIWRNAMPDCSKRTLVLAAETLTIESHILLSRSLDRNNIFFRNIVSKNDVRLIRLNAIASNNDTRSANDVANLNYEAGFDGTMMSLDNWNMNRSDPLLIFEPTCEICMSCANNFLVSQSTGKSYIKLSEDGRKANDFLQKTFPRLLSRDFQSTLQHKFTDVEMGTDTYANVAEWLQNYIFPKVHRLRKGIDLSEPRAIRHPRNLGSHPSCRREIKVVKARYGPCLMLGQGSDCFWFRINKIQYDTLNLETALPLILRRQSGKESH